MFFNFIIFVAETFIARETQNEKFIVGFNIETIEFENFGFQIYFIFISIFIIIASINFSINVFKNVVNENTYEIGSNRRCTIDVENSTIFFFDLQNVIIASFLLFVITINNLKMFINHIEIVTNKIIYHIKYGASPAMIVIKNKILTFNSKKIKFYNKILTSPFITTNNGSK